MALVPIVKSTRSAKFACYAFFLAAVALVSGCATVSFDQPKSESTYIIDTAETELGKWSTQWIDAHDGASGFYPLVGGMDGRGCPRDTSLQVLVYVSRWRFKSSPGHQSDSTHYLHRVLVFGANHLSDLQKLKLIL